MNTYYEEVIKYLKNNKDKKYLEFNKKIISTSYTMLGVRVPIIKKIAKQIKNKVNIEDFLNSLKNKFYEELLLEAYLIGEIKDKDKFDLYFSKYIKKIDCWSLCDIAASTFKIVKDNKDYYLSKIKELVKSNDEFITRMGLVLLLNYYVEDKYINDIFKIVDNIKEDKYYINMAIAWLLSICYIKQNKKTKEYLNITKINKFTYNKTISKICDSYRIEQKEKIKLKKLKRK